MGLALLTIVPFLGTGLDLHLQNLFYHRGATPAWYAESWTLWRLLYKFGPWPALATGLGTLGYLLWSLGRPSLARGRRYALLVILTLALGPGLLVNIVLKNHWGRPRPWQTTEFGGRWACQTALEKGVSGRGRSFPCGHSSMGYFFLAFYFVLRRRHRLLAAAAAIAAAVFGTLIGMARMAAGAHFASDVLWSALIPATIAFLLYYVILRIPQHEDAGDQAPPRLHPLWLKIGAPVAALGLLAAVLAGTHAFADMDYVLLLQTRAASLEVDCESCDLELIFDPDLSNRMTIVGQAQGFGWPWSRLQHRAVTVVTNGLYQAQFSFRRDGHFTELAGHIALRLPVETSRGVRIVLKNGDLIVKAPEGVKLPPTAFIIENGSLVAPPSRQPEVISEPAAGGATLYRLSPAR
jgi:lipid A 4'-phosphatase